MLILPPPGPDVPVVHVRAHVRVMVAKGKWRSKGETLEGEVVVFDPTCENAPAHRPTNPCR